MLIDPILAKFSPDVRNSDAMPVHERTRSINSTRRYTVRELLHEMDTLTKIKYSGKYGHILTEITKSQREILEGLNIALPAP